MDYDGLQMFLELSRSLHFLRASRACHVSPSTLSRVVQRLEQETGSVLLERDRRSVRLTAAGVRFTEHARETLERWQRLQRDLRGPRDALSGSIAIFASVTACQSFLPELLGAFRSRHPDVRIQLETGYAADALERLAEGRVDVSVAAIPPQLPRGLVSRVLLYTPLVFAAPRVACEVERLCHQRPLPWPSLPVVLPASGHARESVDRWFRRRRIVPTVYGEVPGSEAILALVSLGCGIGIVPRLVLDESPLRGKLNVLDADDGAAALGEFRVGVCTQRKKLASPLVRALWDSFAAGTRPPNS
jgi:LysR family transcriptional regulator, positive regulator for ilvC